MSTICSSIQVSFSWVCVEGQEGREMDKGISFSTDHQSKINLHS